MKELAPVYFPNIQMDNIVWISDRVHVDNITRGNYLKPARDRNVSEPRERSNWVTSRESSGVSVRIISVACTMASQGVRSAKYGLFGEEFAHSGCAKSRAIGL